ncbi:hypothetical protein FH972_024740 [Carpinus fangiana]|uniref:Uncharacterized protein n=1 Tax=Carpinus fangiana TaxID=176857 RepID=A0A5N6KZD8_9ROSI|nr:hypothetical protein FH972_024740 [Carpinus fangiana]
MVRSRPVQRFMIKEGSGTGARVWVVPDIFLLDSEEGSSPTCSSWEPKTGSALAALRRARAQEPESRSVLMFPLDSEEGSGIGARVWVMSPLDSEEGSGIGAQVWVGTNVSSRFREGVVTHEFVMGARVWQTCGLLVTRPPRKGRTSTTKLGDPLSGAGSLVLAMEIRGWVDAGSSEESSCTDWVWKALTCVIPPLPGERY